MGLILRGGATHTRSHTFNFPGSMRYEIFFRSFSAALVILRVSDPPPATHGPSQPSQPTTPVSAQSAHSAQRLFLPPRLSIQALLNRSSQL
jgi:hypothetical protein